MEPVSGSLSAQQIIEAVKNLSSRELDEVFATVLAVQAGRKAPNLSSEESALLTRVNEGLPSQIRARLKLLRDRRENGTITDDEYEELTSLTDRAEEIHADRMAALVELARLRGKSLPSLMDQLGIRFPEHV
jgi:hypothetical protein